MKKIKETLKAFLKGASSMTLWPAPIRRKYPFKSEAEAMADDWNTVGLDLHIAIAKFEEESIKNPPPGGSHQFSD
jgi:hypothetical protein